MVHRKAYHFEQCFLVGTWTERHAIIQCDEATPACSQCVKSKRTCPGYPKRFDLILRDETQSTRQRVRRQQNLSPDASYSTDLESSYPTTFQEAFKSCREASFSATLPLLLGPDPSSLEDLAICRFFSNFVLIPRHHEAFQGYLDILPSLYTNAPSESALVLATSAVSLAIAAGDPRCSRESILSRKQVGKAMAMIHKAVGDPVESLTDETLLAVLILGLYEVSRLVHSSHTLRALVSVQLHRQTV